MRCSTLHYNCGFVFLPIFASFILKLLLAICTFVTFVTLTLTFYIVFKCCSSLVMLLVSEPVLSQVYIIALTLLFSWCIFSRPFPLRAFGIVFKVTVQTRILALAFSSAPTLPFHRMGLSVVAFFFKDATHDFQYMHKLAQPSPLSSSRTFYHPPTLCPLAVTSSSHLPPSHPAHILWQSFCLWIYTWTFHTN